MKDIFNHEFWIEAATNFSKWFVNEMPSIVLIIIIFFVGMKFLKKISSKLTDYILNKKIPSHSINKFESQKRINTLIDIFQGTVKIALWIIFIMIIFSKIGIEIAPLLAGAGIVGLAIGFGAQELVRDVISGFFILIENQIRVGDYAIINLTGGTVEKIELRTITLRDLTGTVHIFQNGKISTLSNCTKDWSATVLEIGIAYKENINQVIELMKTVADELRNDVELKEKIIEDIEIMGLDRFDNSAIIIKARIKTIPGEQWAIKREYQNRLKYLFDEKNIEIPFPHTTIYWGEKIPPLKVEMENKN